MAHCTKCGAVIADNAAFCGTCGAPQTVVNSTGVPAGGPVIAPVSPAQTQMNENLAATLSYVLGWLTGLIFFLIDKRPYVRFHATQSIVVFGGLHILTFILGAFFGISLITGGFAGFSIGLALYRILDVVALVLWILLMVKAHQGERYRVPFAADLAERIFGKS
ncbi:MAG TPA: DUF4870 domain-containing protein [Candidatus Acidoferrales bacterium]|jgi:uncharacterized membrane protein|nr:DUF4870 domain-containing protein [Candidatus Acidoferrales bacterium]